MPRDNDKNNGRPPRRDGGPGARSKAPYKGRGVSDRPAGASASRGGDRKFGDKRPSGNKRPYGPRDDGKPRRDNPDARKPYAGKRDDRGGRGPYKPREDRATRDDKPFGGKPRFNRDDRPTGELRSNRGPRKQFGSRDDGSGRAPYKPREDRATRDNKPFGGKPRFNRDERPARFNRDDRPRRYDRTPRRDFERGEDRSDRKPWVKRQPARDERPARYDREEGARKFERPRQDRPRFDKPRDDRAPRGDRPQRDNDWQEGPRRERGDGVRRDERLRRDNEDDSKIFAKRPAFGGRGSYRERAPDFDKRAQRAVPEKKKTGERIAKLVSRAGLCSRRDAEEWITQGRVSVNGRVINSPALDVTARDVVTVDGNPLPERERTRLFLYHKPRGLMTTHADPEGRPTVFDNLPEGLPRLISIGRLDFNTEGLLLLTNDGGLARALELPDTGWLRRYRVRAHGEVKQAQLDALKKGVEVDGVKYGSIDATLERDQGANVWLVFAIREGKNREVRNVMAHLGLEVNRLIRISYGPFQLAELGEGEVEEVKTRVLREQLGEKIVALSGAHFDAPARPVETHEPGKRVKPPGKRALIADRKGRRVLVERSGSDEARARNEEESAGYGPPRRPQRGYKGKRDIRPRDA